MARLNIKSTVKAFAKKIENTQQAELGTAHDGVTIAYYVERALMDVAKELEIDDEIKKVLQPKAE